MPGVVDAPSRGPIRHADHQPRGSRPPGVALYAATIFLSAFLLFQVQPMIGRFILPWFGGTAGVWTTALLFFQVTLLVGYCYAHLVVGRLPMRRQVVVHLVVVGLAALTLPIIPEESLTPSGSGSPTFGILVVLALTVGLPYLVLSTTGPLLQAWFARSHPGRSPYRLYSLSNAASLLALLSYPFVVERVFPLRSQAWAWSAGFVVFAVLVAVISWRQRDAAVQATESAAVGDEAILSSATQFLWLALPAVASMLLIAVTAHLTTNVSPIPLLWIVPLSIYLVSFILTFDSSRWYRRPVFIPLLVASLVATALSFTALLPLGLVSGVVVYSVMLFAATMSLHGELVELKPDPRHLTRFYLVVSAGGALGGVFTGLVAPVIFDGLWELHLGLVLTLVLLLVVRLRAAPPLRLVPAAAALSGIALLAIALGSNARVAQVDVVASDRSFYGVLRVRESLGADPAMNQLTLIHGSIVHGQQFTDPMRAGWPVSYYSEGSGIGVAIGALRASEPLRLGLVGLGTGVIAAYGEAGDDLAFYEIDPSVAEFADEYFTYLDDARDRGAEVSVLLGDGRLVLERQADEGDLQDFDILALDAFSGDAIPVHLLTVEAFSLYRQHLAPDGVMAFHISNRYLDLSPVVRHLAESNDMEAAIVNGVADPERGITASTWVLVTANSQFLADPAVRRAVSPWAPADRDPVRWTDDFNNILSVLR